MLLNQGLQPLVFDFGPVFLGLVHEAPVATVAHFGVAAGKMDGHLVKEGIRVGAELQQKLVFLFSPGSF